MSVSLPLYSPVTGKIIINVLKYSNNTQGRVPHPPPKHDLSIKNDINQCETTTNRKVRSHMIYKLSFYVFFFFTVFGLFWFFTVFCTFLFSNKFAFSFFLILHCFCLVLRFLFNCFWSQALGLSGPQTSRPTLRHPEFSVLTKLKS